MINQNWVVYSISKKGNLSYETINCKKPNLTKFYKNIKKKFNSSDCILEFGYMTEEELFKNDMWVNSLNQIKAYIKL